MTVHFSRSPNHSNMPQEFDISLEKRLRSAIAKGDENSVLALRERSELDKISTANLKNYLYAASFQGYVNIVLVFIGCTKFDDISPDFLEEILKEASMQGHQNIANAFIECRRFDDISAHVLGEIIIGTLEKGHLDVVRTFMNSARSNDISPEHLGEILIGALEKKAPDIALAAIRSKEFSKVLDCYKREFFGENTLREFLRKIVEHGGLDIVNAIIEHKDFDQENCSKNFIHALGFLLGLAILENNLAIVHAILNHKKFDKINPSYLGATLGLAALKKNVVAIDTFMKNTRFLNLEQRHLGTALKQASELADLDTVCALMKHAKFDERSIGYLGEALEKACQESLPHHLSDRGSVSERDYISESDRLNVVKALMSHKGFSETENPHASVDPFHVGMAFRAAAIGGHFNIILFLEHYAKFDNIEIQWFQSALEMASVHPPNILNQNYLRIVQRIMGYGISNDISAESLARALKNASARGHVDIISVFIKHRRFNDIHTEDLEKILLRAVNEGHPEAALAIINSERFGQIRANYLDEILEVASEKGFEKIVQIIMHSENSNEISANVLGKALKKAAERCLKMNPFFLEREFVDRILQKAPEKCYSDIAYIIIQDRRFNEVNVKDLGETLIAASARGHFNIVDAIMDHKNYAKISVEHLQQALREAKENQYSEIARAISKSERLDNSLRQRISRRFNGCFR